MVSTVVFEFAGDSFFLFKIYSRMEIRIPTAQDQRAVSLNIFLKFIPEILIPFSSKFISSFQSTAENGIPFWSPLRKSPLQNASISPPDDK